MYHTNTWNEIGISRCTCAEKGRLKRSIETKVDNILAKLKRSIETKVDNILAKTTHQWI